MASSSAGLSSGNGRTGAGCASCADALFHPDHGVPSAELIAAARKLPDKPVAEVRMKLCAVFRQVRIVCPVRIADAGIEILNVLRAQHRLKRGIQPLARSPMPLILAQVNAHLRRPVIGGAAAERPGIGIANELAAALRDQVRIAAGSVARIRAANSSISGTVHSNVMAVFSTYGA